MVPLQSCNLNLNAWAISSHLHQLQCHAFTWSPFAGFLASFSQASSIDKLAWNVTSHLSCSFTGYPCILTSQGHTMSHGHLCPFSQAAMLMFHLTIHIHSPIQQQWPTWQSHFEPPGTSLIACDSCWTIASRNERIAIAKQCNHLMFHFISASLSNRNVSPSYCVKWRLSVILCIFTLQWAIDSWV